jgi:hypothetical protein
MNKVEKEARAVSCNQYFIDRASHKMGLQSRYTQYPAGTCADEEKKTDLRDLVLEWLKFCSSGKCSPDLEPFTLDSYNHIDPMQKCEAVIDDLSEQDQQYWCRKSYDARQMELWSAEQTRKAELAHQEARKTPYMHNPNWLGLPGR